MDDAGDFGIVALVLIVAACLTIFLLGVTEPTGGLVNFLLPKT